MTFSDTILSAPTSTLDENARLLARRVAGSLQGSTVSCANRNLALLSEDNYLALINAFQDELQRRGVKISPQHATAKIVLTISKRVTDYLGVVQILRGEETETILEPFGRVSDASVVASVLSLQLRKEFLFDQDQPILDIHSADNFTSKDIVTGVEIQERLAVRATNPVEFPGPVISLQSSMDMAKGPSKAVAIVRNLQTGKYEAYVLSITCTD